MVLLEVYDDMVAGRQLFTSYEVLALLQQQEDLDDVLGLELRKRVIMMTSYQREIFLMALCL